MGPLFMYKYADSMYVYGEVWASGAAVRQMGMNVHVYTAVDFGLYQHIKTTCD